jgi:hypothetical protein
LCHALNQARVLSNCDRRELSVVARNRVYILCRTPPSSVKASYK